MAVCGIKYVYLVLGTIKILETHFFLQRKNKRAKECSFDHSK